MSFQPHYIEITNYQFLQSLFGDYVDTVHVTAFPDDPSAIPNERRGICWAGTLVGMTQGQLEQPQLNQYYTISQFTPEGRWPVRRKANFVACYVVVLDDVLEKIPQYLAERLPLPTYRLETSPGSEHWGFKLLVPETDRRRVENLLDGLVAQGLCPDGKDPGMKGVTRYVRLPFGSNTKAKHRQADGSAFRCRLLELHPDRTVAVEQLAGVFSIDLNRSRSDERLDGGAHHADHPVLQRVTVLEDKGEGEYLIECPWLDEHSDGDNSGTWLITHGDGSIGFQCHHGHCQERTGKDLLDKLAVRAQQDTWKAFKDVPGVAQARRADPGGGGGLMGTTMAVAPKVGVADFLHEPIVPVGAVGTVGVVDFLHEPIVPVGAIGTVGGELAGEVVTATPPWQQAIDALVLPLGDLEAVRVVLRAIAGLGGLEASAAMGALKGKLRRVVGARELDAELGRLRREITGASIEGRVAGQGGINRQRSPGFDRLCRDWVYVASADRFVNRGTSQMLSERAFRNAHMHLEGEIEELSPLNGEAVRPDIIRCALSGGLVKVDTMDYWPEQPEFYEDDGSRVFNLWRYAVPSGVWLDGEAVSVEGYGVLSAQAAAALPWLEHLHNLGWASEDIYHVLDWMAYTLQHPGEKINHMLVFGGREGIGKDFILYPMTMALGSHSRTIDGHLLGESFNEYLMQTKHLHINELEAGNHKERATLSQRVKPLAAAPPLTLPVNQKGIPRVDVRNIVNTTATTNDPHSLDLREGSRRYYMVWSDLSIRGADGQITPEWSAYWAEKWPWMREHWEVCLGYLMRRDVGGFDPGQVPRVTEHQRDLVEASQGPLETYLEDQLGSGRGVFERDMVTAERVFQQIQLGGEMLLARYGFRNPPSVQAIGRVLTAKGLVKRRARCYQGTVRARRTVYFLRNLGDYLGLTGEEIINLVDNYPPVIPYA